eukprot:TRINITY_DN7850_c0_g1_i1.p1 TRINITY_DN7850_c0_g1~~TRINITY_DN7850_c0_g1_i1.p1  ORF type:complete len:348 (-),score=48.67 TRINITY_DN7850_c0_g1_i1:8-1051(-)
MAPAVGPLQRVLLPAVIILFFALFWLFTIHMDARSALRKQRTQLDELERMLHRLQESKKQSHESRETCSNTIAPPRVQPILHFLNIKADSLFKTILLNRFPRPNPAHRPLVIEVGSNDGKQAVWAAQQGYKVVSFEPAPAGFRRCTAALEQAKQQSPSVELEFRNQAVSERAGSVYFLDTGGVVSRIVNQTTPGAVRVPTTTLDRELMGEGEVDVEIAFLKIDVEGHELAVLRGAQQLLASRRLQFIQLEFNPTQILKHGFGSAADLLSTLHEHGYDIYDMRIWEFESKSGGPLHAVLSEENKWNRPAGFTNIDTWFRPARSSGPWGAWTDILAVRRDTDAEGSGST